jgi:hypothetical protein
MRNQYLLSSIRLLFIVLSPLLLTVMASETQEPMTSPPYSVQEISSLTNLYELRIKMNYLPEGCLRYPPHSSPLISTEPILSKVLDPKIAEVMQGIPYIDSTNESDPKILFDSTTASYIDKGVLEESRTLYLPPDDSGGELLEPWVMPLTLAGQPGYHALFDAKSGMSWNLYNVILSRHNFIGELIKWKWMEAAPSSQNHDYQYRNFPSVHITQFLKGIIDDYQTLRCVPFSYGISPAGDPTVC